MCLEELTSFVRRHVVHDRNLNTLEVPIANANGELRAPNRQAVVLTTKRA